MRENLNNKFFDYFIILTVLISWSLYVELYFFPNAYLHFSCILVLLFYFLIKGFFINNKSKFWLFYFSISLFLVVLSKNDVHIFNRNIWLFLSLLIVPLLYKYISIRTFKRFLFVLLVIYLLSFVDFVYALLGNSYKDIFRDFNRSGNHIYKFIFTITNTKILNLIRVSGIYDEPGALAFVQAAVIINVGYNENKKTINLINLLSLLTFSLANVVFLFVYYTGLIIRKNISRLNLFLGIFLVLLLANSEAKYSEDLNFFTKRFEVSDGKLKGDSRSYQIDNFFNELDFKTFLIGQEVERLNLIDVSSNFFTPLYYNGIFIALPFYLFLIVLVFFFLKYKNEKFLILFLILLQRPYFFEMGYSLLITLTFYNIYCKKTYD